MSQTKTETNAEKRNIFMDSESGEAFLILKFKLSIIRIKDHQAKQ